MAEKKKGGHEGEHRMAEVHVHHHHHHHGAGFTKAEERKGGRDAAKRLTRGEERKGGRDAAHKEKRGRKGEFAGDRR